jgi:pyruvate dehydrogenase E1 component
MLPFYIYYSMFGFQRVGDQIWAAADQNARGFLIGATAGRTTLGGEGLQHQDGTSHLIAGTIPNCKAYDPAFAGELAVIIEQGMREMVQEQSNVFYYITAMNANYAQPSIDLQRRDAILKGGYRFLQLKPDSQDNNRTNTQPVNLMASGALMPEAIEAAQTLHHQGYTVNVFSVTSWSELARDQTGWVAELISDNKGPVIGRQHIPAGQTYVTLGTDGFGRSDTRAVLREFFGVNARHIVHAALSCS